MLKKKLPPRKKLHKGKRPVPRNLVRGLWGRHPGTWLRKKWGEEIWGEVGGKLQGRKGVGSPVTIHRVERVSVKFFDARTLKCRGGFRKVKEEKKTVVGGIGELVRAGFRVGPNWGGKSKSKSEKT